MTRKGHVWARIFVLIELYLAISIGVFFFVVFVLENEQPSGLEIRSITWLDDALLNGVWPAYYVLWMGHEGLLLAVLLAASLILPFVFGRRYVRASGNEWRDWLFLYGVYWFVICGISAFLYVSISKAAS